MSNTCLLFKHLADAQGQCHVWNTYHEHRKKYVIASLISYVILLTMSPVHVEPKSQQISQLVGQCPIVTWKHTAIAYTGHWSSNEVYKVMHAP